MFASYLINMMFLLEFGLCLFRWDVGFGNGRIRLICDRVQVPASRAQLA